MNTRSSIYFLLHRFKKIPTWMYLLTHLFWPYNSILLHGFSSYTFIFLFGFFAYTSIFLHIFSSYAQCSHIHLNTIFHSPSMYLQHGFFLVLLNLFLSTIMTFLLWVLYLHINPHPYDKIHALFRLVPPPHFWLCTKYLPIWGVSTLAIFSWMSFHFSTKAMYIIKTYDNKENTLVVLTKI